MSYDIAVVIPPIAGTDAAAWKDLGAMIEQGGAPPALLRSEKGLRDHDDTLAERS